MVRRIGFSEPSGTSRPTQSAEGAQDAAPERQAEQPKATRNWTRIVFQILWVDLWTIAVFMLGQGVVRALVDGGAAVSIEGLLFLSAAFFGWTLAVRKMLRLLRGTPVAGEGS